MTTKGDVLIKVDNVHKVYANNLHALNGVSETISKGEVVVIVGPSGSGKSTFLRSLNLLEVPTSGHIYFEGVDITSKATDINKHRQKMGMVFQHFNLFPHKTILFYSSTRRRFSDAMACRSASEKPIRSSSKKKF